MHKIQGRRQWHAAKRKLIDWPDGRKTVFLPKQLNQITHKSTPTVRIHLPPASKSLSSEKLLAKRHFRAFGGLLQVRGIARVTQSDLALFDSYNILITFANLGHLFRKPMSWNRLPIAVWSSAIWAAFALPAEESAIANDPSPRPAPLPTPRHRPSVAPEGCSESADSITAWSERSGR